MVSPWKQVEEGAGERSHLEAEALNQEFCMAGVPDVRRETAVCRDRKGHEFKDFYKLWL